MDERLAYLEKINIVTPRELYNHEIKIDSPPPLKSCNAPNNIILQIEEKFTYKLHFWKRAHNALGAKSISESDAISVPIYRRLVIGRPFAGAVRWCRGGGGVAIGNHSTI